MNLTRIFQKAATEMDIFTPGQLYDTKTVLAGAHIVCHLRSKIFKNKAEKYVCSSRHENGASIMLLNHNF